MGTETFTAKGLMIKERNWLEVYDPWERWSSGAGMIPTLLDGAQFRPSKLLMTESVTQAPNAITEVELITEMDKYGIGTDATIAQHITTIQERNYATKDHQQRFHPTKLGIALCEGYNSMGYQLNKPALRAKMERDCNEIAAGRKTKVRVVADTLKTMKDCFQVVQNEVQKLDAAMARHYPLAGQNATTVNPSFSKCAAGHSMQLKEIVIVGGANLAQQGQQPRRNMMLFCATCNESLKLPFWGTPTAAANATKCSYCRYEHIIITGDDGRASTMCPYCAVNTPVAFTTALMKCPQCAVDGVQGGEQGEIMVKLASTGPMLCCTRGGSKGEGCPYKIWLPKKASKVEVLQDACNCALAGPSGCRNLRFTWESAGAVPPQMMGFQGPETDFCVLCDDDLHQYMGVSVPRVVRGAGGARGGVGAAARDGGGGTRGGGGGGAAGGARQQQQQQQRAPPPPRQNFVHNARPPQAANGNGPVLFCFRCNTGGHVVMQCPQGR